MKEKLLVFRGFLEADGAAETQHGVVFIVINYLDMIMLKASVQASCDTFTSPN